MLVMSPLRCVSNDNPQVSCNGFTSVFLIVILVRFRFAFFQICGQNQSQKQYGSWDKHPATSWLPCT
jgi:hypothetical protein